MLSVPYAEKRDFWVCIKASVLQCWYALFASPCSLVQSVLIVNCFLVHLFLMQGVGPNLAINFAAYESMKSFWLSHR